MAFQGQVRQSNPMCVTSQRTKTMSVKPWAA